MAELFIKDNGSTVSRIMSFTIKGLKWICTEGGLKNSELRNSERYMNMDFLKANDGYSV